MQFVTHMRLSCIVVVQNVGTSLRLLYYSMEHSWGKLCILIAHFSNVAPPICCCQMKSILSFEDPSNSLKEIQERERERVRRKDINTT